MGVNHKESTSESFKFQLLRKMSAETVSYKVFLKDKENAEEVRRFVVDKDVSTSFTYLQEKLYTVFPQLKQKIFSVSWTDEDGDNVTIGMDEELIIALTEMPGPVYKLKVVVKNVEKSTNSGDYQKETTEEKNLIHHGVTCDSCEKTPIEGYRYKCVVCDDFDLCGICEAAGRHPGHNMMRIANPEMVFPQRLFKRIHKMQERAEKSRSRHEKDKGDSSGLPAGGNVPPPPFGFPGRGRGMFRGRGFGGMRGMGPTRDCSGVGAWAGPAFDAMMRDGWESNLANRNLIVALKKQIYILLSISKLMKLLLKLHRKLMSKLIMLLLRLLLQQQQPHKMPIRQPLSNSPPL